MSATTIRAEQVIETTVNAIIIYDDIELATKANAISGRAMQHADTTAQWQVKPWRVNLLTLTGLADAALNDAADAHLVVFALREAEPLRPSLVAWLDQWAAYRQVPDAALAVFGGRNGEEHLAPATSELSHFAERHGLSCIFDDGHPVKSESELFSARQETHSFGFVEGVIWVWPGTLSTQNGSPNLFLAVLRLLVRSVLGLRAQFFR